jgi:integrase
MVSEQAVVDTQIEKYLRYCEFNREFTPDTLKTKYYHLNRVVKDNSVNDFREITNEQIDDWRAKMFEAGIKKKTINNKVDDVVACVRFLKHRQREDVALNLDSVERYRIRYSNEDLPSFTAEEIVAIKRHCKTLIEELTFSMTFETAMRLHEVTYLQVEDIRKNPNDSEYLRIEGKGRVKRNTFMLPDTKALLGRWLALTGIEEGYIFPSPVKQDMPYTNNQMRKIISRPIRRAGFDVGSPHALRRSSITIALDNGMPLAKASKWAGHSDPRITLKHYYKPDNELLQDQHHKALSSALALASA